jgi:hypothetical protein
MHSRKKANPWRLIVTALTVTTICHCLCPPVSAQAQLDKAAIVKQAAQSYYSVRAAGLIEFQARVTPTWEVALKDTNPNPEGLKLLNALKFTVFFDAENAVRVDHEVGIAAPNEKVQASFDRVFAGIQQVLEGYFETWDLFMINNPFPVATGAFDLKAEGSGYVISFKETVADVTVNMNKDFTVTLVRVVSPEFNSSISPQFTRTDKGFVLVAYSAKYVPTKGPGAVDLNVQIDYQDVQALKLPQRVRAHSVLDGQATDVELVLSEYQVKKR